MFTNWSFIESDFRKEYSINLIKDIIEMTWRQFRVLLFGLPSSSVYGRIISSAFKEHEAKEKIITNPKVAMHMFDGWGI